MIGTAADTAAFKIADIPVKLNADPNTDQHKKNLNG
jgi:hypothetical protein